MSAKSVWMLGCLLIAGNVVVAGDATFESPTVSDKQWAGVNDDDPFDDLFTGEAENVPASQENANLFTVAQRAAHGLLLWIGFGTLVGLTAKAIMPGRDPGGPVATLLMGIAGSLIGCGVLLLLGSSYRVTPISPLGFIAGIAGAFLLLLFYRILSNSYVVEATDGAVFKRARQKPSV